MKVANNPLRWKMGVPVATPVGLGELRAALTALLTAGEPQGLFESELREFLGAGWVRATNSGRAALYLALIAMKMRSRRNEVVIPAFVCPSVGRAVVKAGLKPVLCDVGQGGSGLDMEDLHRKLSERTLGVVTAHLFGYPVEVDQVVALTRSAGARVIEDGAQAFGAKIHGRRAGTNADVGVFSFGMSKVLWCFGGGAVCSNDRELAAGIESAASGVRAPAWRRELLGTAKCAVLSGLIRSHYLGPVAAVWNGALRGRGDCEDFRAELCPKTASGVGRRLIGRFEEITAARRRNAERYATGLAGLEDITLPESHDDVESVYLRFPVIVSNIEAKRAILDRLRRAGINASEMYTQESYEALRTFAAGAPRCQRAEYLMERMVDLPTHHHVRDFELEFAIRAFWDVLAAKAPEDFTGKVSGRAEVRVAGRLI
jgi:perosamine synthetase